MQQNVKDQDDVWLVPSLDQCRKHIHEVEGISKKDEYLAYLYLPEWLRQYKEFDILSVVILETSNTIKYPQDYHEDWENHKNMKQFKRCYFAPSSGIYFWCHSRRICSVDGCFKRTKVHGGIVLTFTVKAACNSLVTLAIAHVDVENSWNWYWFYNLVYYTFPGIHLMLSDKFAGKTTIKTGSLSQENFIKRLYERRLEHLIEIKNQNSDISQNEVFKASRQLLKKLTTEERTPVPVIGGCSVHVLRNVAGNSRVGLGPYLALSPTEFIFDKRVTNLLNIGFNQGQVKALKDRAGEFAFCKYGLNTVYGETTTNAAESQNAAHVIADGRRMNVIATLIGVHEALSTKFNKLQQEAIDAIEAVDNIGIRSAPNVVCSSIVKEVEADIASLYFDFQKEKN